MTGRTCGVEGCLLPYNSRGYCQPHLRRLRKYGDPLGGHVYRPRGVGTEWERFWRYVNKTPTCWLWTGATISGYGKWNRPNGVQGRAHRLTYEWLVGQIPAGLQLDHLCKTPACVNPTHLEPVTGTENKRRSDSLATLNAAKTHCKRGHPFDEANTWMSHDGARHCRTCNRDRARARRARQAAA